MSLSGEYATCVSKRNKGAFRWVQLAQKIELFAVIGFNGRMQTWPQTCCDHGGGHTAGFDSFKLTYAFVRVEAGTIGRGRA